MYTGAAVTPCSAGVAGAGGLGHALAIGYANNTAPGANSATASASFTGDSNHQASSDAKSFSILFSLGSCLGAVGHTILQPINVDGSSVFKQGSTVPAKFRVCDASGNSLGFAGVVASFKLAQTISGTEATTVNEDVTSTTPDTTFRWSSSDQQWIFNINTKTLAKNKTYVYLVTLADATTITFSFGLR